MKLSLNEIARRQPVWWALSELFLDTEHSQEWLRKLAETIQNAAFSLNETHDIFLTEVAPAFYLNHLSVAGEWKGWSETYVEERVTQYLRSSAASRFLNLRMSKLVRPETSWKAFSPVLEEVLKSSAAAPAPEASSP